MRIAVAIIMAILCCACQTPPLPEQPINILFVGNSLTYTGNLPAVFSSLAAVNDKNVTTAMIANGGATLSERLHNGTVKDALQNEKYSHVILQERGGDFICAFGPESCLNAETATAKLARLVQGKGARALLLGSYQMQPGVSVELVNAEQKAASAANIELVAVSNRFQIAVETERTGKWLYKDNTHPGSDLVLLQAVLLYQQIFHELPAATGFQVKALIFRPNTRFPQGIHKTTDGVDQGTPMSYDYSSADLAMVLRIIARNTLG